jgi:hypothetical protein
MRSLLSTLIIVLFAITGSAQSTTVPSGILEFTSPTFPPHILGNTQNTSKQFIISAGSNVSATGPYLHLFPVNTSNYANGGGHIDLVSVGGESAGEAIVFTNYDPTLSSFQYKKIFVARKDGKVLIGENLINNNLFNGNYKLFVESGILTERVKVAIKTTGDWADYVFKSDYQLMNLDSVENFIKKNSHLPGIPSAEMMVKEGNDLAITDARLLAKIEELTLYIINLNKENQELQRKVNELKSKDGSENASLEELKAEIEKIKKLLVAQAK